ncbi:MAG: cation transporter [Trueperaceae bacterium]
MTHDPPDPQARSNRVDAGPVPGDDLPSRTTGSRAESGPGALHRSEFDVPRMDCAAEEQMVRMALDRPDVAQNVRRLEFDLQQRRLSVFHVSSSDAISAALDPLGLGARLTHSRPLDREERAAIDAVGSAEGEAGAEGENARQARVLTQLLVINGTMFLIEIVTGFLAQSTGLIADALDMFADAAVYGVSLYAVGRAAAIKLRAARLAGWLQLALALGVLAEVIRRAIFGSEPVSALMMGMGAVALAANVASLLLLARHRGGGAHMRASWIFSTNDVLANLGVIVAGALVLATGSALPDLVIGTVIALVVANGARRILALRG